MNTQEAYEYMRVYLTREGARQATDDQGDCMYEAVVGGELHRCAVGCLLTPKSLNSKSQPRVRGEKRITLRDYLGSAEGLLRRFPVPELRDVELKFLVDAQELHDEAENWKGGRFNVALLDGLALNYGLKVVVDAPVVEETVAEPEPVLTLA